MVSNMLYSNWNHCRQLRNRYWNFSSLQWKPQIYVIQLAKPASRKMTKIKTSQENWVLGSTSREYLQSSDLRFVSSPSQLFSSLSVRFSEYSEWHSSGGIGFQRQMFELSDILGILKEFP